jgi:hypothetical protein
MQQRRFRPGDVLDDYCPRERRITDHAVVAMIDDRIKQTRCVVCDAEHEYKEGKLPPQRRKRPQAALFSQVLDGLQSPQPVARLTHLPDTDPDHNFVVDEPETFATNGFAPIAGNGHQPDRGDVEAKPVVPHRPVEAPSTSEDAPPESTIQAPPPYPEEGPVRRPLIRATLPRPDGQPVPARALPEFTIRQPHNTRGGHRPGGRRRGSHPQQAGPGGQGTRYGRGAHGQQQRSSGGRGHGPHGRSGGPRRGGKKR